MPSFWKRDLNLPLAVVATGLAIYGTLFANASQLLGQPFAFLEMTIIPDYSGFLLFILPPGGFIILGLLIAGKRVLDARINAAQQRKAATTDSARAAV